MWQVKFLNEAKKDLAKLDNSLKGQVLKGIAKVRTNPLPVPAWLMVSHWETKVEII